MSTQTINSAMLANPVAEAERGKLETALKNGAGWFFWIAGLSLVNSLSAAMGSDWGFIFGLGITQVFDGVASQMASGAKFIAFGINCVIAAVFVLFGVFAQRRSKAAFLVGMVIYGLDGGLSLLVGDWLGVIVHGLALAMIFGGYAATRKLDLQPAPAAA